MSAPRINDEAFLDPALMASRFERIEMSLAQIAQAQERMGAALEKLAGLEASRKYVEDAIDDHEMRIRAIEIRQPLHQQTTDWAGRLITGLLAGVGMAILGMVLK